MREEHHVNRNCDQNILIYLSENEIVFFNDSLEVPMYSFGLPDLLNHFRSQNVNRPSIVDHNLVDTTITDVLH
jgi:hypothetical protein